MHTQEYAVAVMKHHQSTVLYKSTDNVMKYSEFEKLCLQSVSTPIARVVAQQLMLNGQLAKRGTDSGYEVVKLSSVKEKGIEVTEVDVGIVR